MIPLLVLGGVAAASLLLSGCSRKEEPKEKSNEPLQPHPPIVIYAPGFDNGRSLRFAEEAYQTLQKFGLKDEQIDRGYHLYGNPLDPVEKPLAAGDGRIHECELYRSARELLAHDPDNEALKKLAGSLKTRSEEDYKSGATNFGVFDSCFSPPSADSPHRKAQVPYVQRAVCMNPENGDALWWLAMGQEFPVAEKIYQRLLNSPAQISPEHLQDLKQEVDVSSEHSNKRVDFALKKISSERETVREVRQGKTGPADSEKVDKAIATYHEALDLLEPRWRSAEHYLNLGILLYSREKIEEAVGFFEKAVQQEEELRKKLEDEDKKAGRKPFNYLSSEFGEAHLFWGDCLMKQGKLQEANSHLKLAEKVLKDRSSAYKHLIPELLLEIQKKRVK